MASTSSPAGDWGIVTAVARGHIEKLKKKRDEIGDKGKFRRMCDTDSYDGFRALHSAILGKLEMCKFLVEEVGVDIDVKTDRGVTPLIIAAMGGKVDIAKYLISRGADITMTDYNGCTALHCSIPCDDTEIFTLLLSKGADIEADSVGGTPLHCAAQYGKPGIVKFLLQNNAEPDSVSKYLRISPLISAIYSKKNTVECVKLLLKANADPNKFANGLNPLAHAIRAKSNSCINSLIAAGADVNSVSSCGLRPIEYAALVNNDKAIYILLHARPRILAAPNWRLADIYSVEVKQRIDLHIRKLKQNGDDSWAERDYSSAIASYSEAMVLNPRDEKLLANRSLCWVCMGEAAFALHDAMGCVDLKPGWAKAHLREAVAWHLLKRYRMSSDTFKRAFGMAPENEQIERSGR
ncbi:hypothetical protein ACS0TY_007422 [Phlomoides rotata]